MPSPLSHQMMSFDSPPSIHCRFKPNYCIFVYLTHSLYCWPCLSVSRHMSQANHSGNNMAFITMATQPPSSGLPQSSALLSSIVTSSMATTTPPSSVHPAAPPPDSQAQFTPPASQEGDEVVHNTSAAQVGVWGWWWECEGCGGSVRGVVGV